MNLEEWIQPQRTGRKCWRGVGVRFTQGSNTNKKWGGKFYLARSNEGMALFSKSSSSEIIALCNNWGMPSGSWWKWSWVQFGEICYAQLPPINSSGSDVPDLLLGILWKQLLFTAFPLKEEIHEQGLTGQKITVYVSTYLRSAAKNFVSSAPGNWLQLPASGLPGNISKEPQISIVRLGCLERLDWVEMVVLQKVSRQHSPTGLCWAARKGGGGGCRRVRCQPKLKASWEVWSSRVVGWRKYGSGDSKTKVKPKITLTWANH